jgi:hypothetical protein
VAATWRLFFKDGPERVECRIVSRHPVTGVDTAFSVLATFGEGRSYIGHFGFDTEYQNRLTVIGPRLAATVDRVFTTPPDVNGQLSVNRCNQHSDMTAPAGDSFELFFSRVVDSVKNGSWTPLANDLLEDARMMEKLRQSALKV